MLVIRFGSADLANVRFAISPLVEVHRSAKAIDNPAAGALHLPWIRASRELVPGPDLELLRALQPPRAYTPDFTHPPPSSPLAQLEDELTQMLATPPDQIRAEIRRAYRGRGLPAVLEPFIDDPAAAAAGLADVIRRYWRLVLAPHWERVRSMFEGDILYRARQLADGGATRLFADIHPEARFEDDALLIEKPFSSSVKLDGRGLLFIPSAFVWPALAAIVRPPWQPALIYPARGVGTLWEPGRIAAPAALSALLGQRRTAVLADLDAPRSTTELARRLGLSAPSVSQHLAVLRDAGLVNGNRVARTVLYARTSRGTDLLDLGA